MYENVLLAFGLTLFAGLATGIGSLFALFTSRTNTKFLSWTLGFSAGVMIYVSMVEIFVKAKEALVSEMGEQLGNWTTVAGFFGGMLLIAIIDKFVPESSNPHEVKKVEDMNLTKSQAERQAADLAKGYESHRANDKRRVAAFDVKLDTELIRSHDANWNWLRENA